MAPGPVNYNPWLEQDEPAGGRPRITYSPTELLHLGAAVVILSLALWFVLGSGNFAAVQEAGLTQLAVGLTSFLAVASGFVLHELAHKIAAQRYGHWAEFRAQFGGLGISLLVAAFLKLLFAAPGAVVIFGRVTPRENGIISIVGPGVNLAIAGGCALVSWLTQGTNPTPVPTIFYVVAFVNALLAVFNLVPVGPLDGRKVLAWNKPVYAVAMTLAIGLFVLVLVSLG